MAAIITVFFSHHRPEIIPLAVARMRRHAVIVLEEPPDDAFAPMLEGKIPVDEYVMGIETEYPDFSRRMCRELRGLHREGRRILQIEPFLEALLCIHERLAEGRKAAELKDEPLLWRVYQSERQATGALIDFYAAAASRDVDATLAAVKDFARMDAHRFALRDAMRAQGIADALGGDAAIYVEAGQMHVGLAQALRSRAKSAASVRTTYLLADVAASFGAPGCLFGPGDVLTLLYRYHPGYGGAAADLLAARALIYNKIVAKSESGEDPATFPHTRDEIETLRIVRQLNLSDCRRLLPVIDRMTTEKARRTIEKDIGTEGHHLRTCRDQPSRERGVKTNDDNPQ